MQDPPQSETSTLDDARAHARSQAAGGRRRSGGLGSTELWRERVPPGNYATHRLPRDAVLRLTAVEGDTCVALVVHRAGLTAERLNVADTVKVQWQAYPSTGTVLLSDMGRALMTVVEDTCPPRSHDALSGCTNSRSAWRPTPSTSAALPGAPGGAWTDTPSGRDLLLAGLAKSDLERRDLPPCVDLFSGVVVHDDGSLHRSPPVPAGSTVVLRAEVAVIVTLAVAPHPLDDRSASSLGAVEVAADVVPRPDPDPHRTSTPERERAFDNTEDSLLAGQP